MIHATDDHQRKLAPKPEANCTSASELPQSFDWPLANEAEQFLRERIALFLDRNSFAHRLADRMRAETGTDLFEWVDHLVLAPGEEPALRETGFVPNPQVETPNGDTVYECPRTTLPRVILRPADSAHPRRAAGVRPFSGAASFASSGVSGLSSMLRGSEAAAPEDGRTPAQSPSVAVSASSAQRDKQYPSVLALRPESVAEFMACHNLPGEPEGEPCSRYRRILVAEENGTQLEAVERRAYTGFVPVPLMRGELANIVKARELWRTRPRLFPTDAEGIRAAHQTLDRALGLVGPDLACQFFFEAERAYWQSRNRAGRMQKHRQDQLGLGWGNHDHHTFRCSREHFVDLVQVLLKLGFGKRERYYAGAEAGWGAQISEQPVAGIVVFADVDLLPEETELDFSTHKLPPAPRLGTVGLWVGLHGESLLEAGMHDLEARFDFDFLRAQFRESGVNTMSPFSDFQFLRQAFTEGERWPVRRDRAERLLADGLITREQAEQFIREGALGSHLENLQRHGGFKGFNQKSVSVVIAATDPRKNHFRPLSAAA
jgi:hypothetical protein